MITEKRNDIRTPFGFDVMICYEPFGLLRGRTRNVSLEGMFVETGQVRLPKNVCVQVVFSIPGVEKAQSHQIFARVVHSSKEGAGLAFMSSKLTALQALVGVLKAA